MNKLINNSSKNKIVNKVESLFDEAPYIGDVTEIDYQYVTMLSNDYNISQAYYLPKGAFLLVKVEALNPKDNDDTQTMAAILCRVEDVTFISAPSLNETKSESKSTKSPKLGASKKELEKMELEKLNQRKLSFFRLNCKILGTFSQDKRGNLKYGSDAYFFAVSNIYSVYKPINSSLEQIVNYNKMGNFKDVTSSLLTKLSSTPVEDFESFRIGYVRYASSFIDSPLNVFEDEGVNKNYIELDESSFEINPSDFLRQRTGIFGMKGMGKSNTVKMIANSVIKMANNLNVKIGQLIYDINGEYSSDLENDGNNPNKNLNNENMYGIDHGLLERNSDLVPALNNFYLDPLYSLGIMKKGVRESGKEANILNNFLQIKDLDKNILTHIFWTLFLLKSGCTLPSIICKQKFPDFTFQCQVDLDGKSQGFSWLFDKQVATELQKMPILKKYIGAKEKGSYLALNLKSMKELLLDIDTLRNQTYNTLYEDFDQKTLTSFIMQTDLNAKGSVIQGWQMIAEYSYLHCEYANIDYKEKIYQSLLDGKAVFINLSIGKQFAKQYIADELMSYILEKQVEQYRQDHICPLINVFIEEAQNVLGHNNDETIWTNIAYDGFKYNIGFVYGTQQPSAIHPAILSNTTNFIVAHLNNAREISLRI
jgi:hypothetical protein